MDFDQIQRIASFFETMDPMLNVQQLRCIGWIMQQFDKDPNLVELPMSSFIKGTGITQAGASRTCAYFGNRRNSKVPGLRLVDRVTDKINTRHRNIVLTTKGRAVLRQLQEL